MDVGRGVGRRLALALARMDNTMVLWDREHDAVMATTGQINKVGGRAYGHAVDLSDKKSVKEACTKVWMLHECCLV